MIILQDNTIPKVARCICIGCFDGIHKGHRAIIRAACQYADNKGIRSLLYTFSPFKNTQVLLNDSEKIRRIEELGVDEYYLQEFTPEFASTMPVDFVRGLKDKFSVKCIVVGPDFTFGKGGSAGVDELDSICAQMDVECIIVPLVMQNGRKVSSTAIREALEQGDISLAEEMLGGIYVG